MKNILKKILSKNQKTKKNKKGVKKVSKTKKINIPIVKKTENKKNKKVVKKIKNKITPKKKIKEKLEVKNEPSIGLEPRYIQMVFEILDDLQKNEKKTIILVEQNAKKGLEFADIGYVLVSGQTAIAGKGDELLNNPDVGRLFLGG